MPPTKETPEERLQRLEHVDLLNKTQIDLLEWAKRRFQWVVIGGGLTLGLSGFGFIQLMLSGANRAAIKAEYQAGLAEKATADANKAVKDAKVRLDEIDERIKEALKTANDANTTVAEVGLKAEELKDSVSLVRKDLDAFGPQLATIRVETDALREATDAGDASLQILIDQLNNESLSFDVREVAATAIGQRGPEAKEKSLDHLKTAFLSLRGPTGNWAEEAFMLAVGSAILEVDGESMPFMLDVLDDSRDGHRGPEISFLVLCSFERWSTEAIAHASKKFADPATKLLTQHRIMKLFANCPIAFAGDGTAAATEDLLILGVSGDDAVAAELAALGLRYRLPVDGQLTLPALREAASRFLEEVSTYWAIQDAISAIEDWQPPASGQGTDGS